MLPRRAENQPPLPLRKADKASPSSTRPIDLVHLARQTCGDRTLEKEILQLLDGQVRLFVDRIHLASAEERRRIAHAICGAGRNVGAFRLASAAERLGAEPGSQPALLALLDEATSVRTFIASLVEE